MKKNSDSLLPIVGVYLLLFAAFALYRTAVGGPFVFDDEPNLAPLGYFGGVVDWPTALYFIFGNHSGPFGRVLSMASFLLNDNTWPSDPSAFKYTNILLHLLNICLVFYASLLLFEKLGKGERANWLALGAAAIWSLHPIHVSAVIYVVQRMTLISAAFELAAIIFYLKFRNSVTSFKAAIISGVSIGLLTAIGMAAKETALVVVFLLATLEFIVFRKSAHVWRWLRPALALACIVVVAAIISQSIGKSEIWVRREFSLVERLLTESRILWDYLGNFFFPRPADFSLFNDDYYISRSLVEPASTLISLLAWIATIGLLGYFRGRLLAARLALAWYVGGHLLESTTIPLELYFDHRNYLPILGFCWLIVLVIERLVPGHLARAASYLLGILFLTFVTKSSLMVWESEGAMARVLAIEHPRSPRAQQLLVRDALDSGNLELARSALSEILQRDPRNTLLIVQKAILTCLAGDELDLSYYKDALATGKYTHGVAQGLKKLHSMVRSGECGSVPVEAMSVLYTAVEDNPLFAKTEILVFLEMQRAEMAAQSGDLNLAMRYMDRAYKLDSTNVQFPLTQAYWLCDAGLYSEAKEYLLRAKYTKPPRVMQKYQYEMLVEKAKRYIYEQERQSTESNRRITESG